LILGTGLALSIEVHNIALGSVHDQVFVASIRMQAVKHALQLIRISGEQTQVISIQNGTHAHQGSEFF